MVEKAAMIAAVLVGTGFGGAWLLAALRRSLRPELPAWERRAALLAAMVPVACSGLMALQAVASR